MVIRRKGHQFRPAFRFRFNHLPLLPRDARLPLVEVASQPIEQGTCSAVLEMVLRWAVGCESEVLSVGFSG